jgi:hypothetical protein
MRPAFGLTLALAVSLGACNGWEAQGGTAELVLRGALPWTDEGTEITASIFVDGANQADASVNCSLRSDDGYTISAYTAELDELKRVRVVLRIPRFAGTSSYGGDEDPSAAFGGLSLRASGENSWTSDGDQFPCTGWVDTDSLEGGFTCVGITGRTSEATASDGPIDFDLSYLCGPGTN